MLYVVCLLVWWYALYFQIVPVHRALAALNVYRIEGIPGALIFFGSPAVAAAALIFVWTRLRRFAASPPGGS